MKKRQEKQRWMLHRRDAQNWELVPPQGTIYLDQDDAVRLMAQQLAAMTAEDSPVMLRQKAQLAALLGSTFASERIDFILRLTSSGFPDTTLILSIHHRQQSPRPAHVDAVIFVDRSAKQAYLIVASMAAGVWPRELGAGRAFR